MPIASPESLVRALRESRLFSAAEVAAIAAELTLFGNDLQAAVRHLVRRNRVPIYQLRKIVHGKAAELFVGPYVIVDKLGEGGMGKVFRACDTRTGQTVALKVVRPHLLANPVIRGRYEREVQTALTLIHPNITAALEAGEAGGRYYLAMEFVDGIDLSRLVRTYGLLAVPEACEYLRQAALGLHYAHERGFVHRDIKPANIVVSGERHVPEASEPAQVKILDMGLVRSVGFDEEGDGPDLTRAGTVVGTPDYMAPEQAKNSSTVDHRADLYALGGTFYFLLTGRPPFPVSTPIEKILKHQIDPPPPLQAIRPDVPDKLARIVNRLMAKKPADRFATAAELAAALLPLTRFEPGAALPSICSPFTGADDYARETPPASVSVLTPPSSIETRAAPSPIEIPQFTPAEPPPVPVKLSEPRLPHRTRSQKGFLALIAAAILTATLAYALFR